MRIYKSDGTFEENRDDTEFGWYFSEVLPAQGTATSTIKDENTANSNCAEPAKDENKFLESVDIVELPEPPKPLVIKKISPNVEVQPIISVLDCKMEIEGLSMTTCEPKLRELKNINCTIPPREQLANLVTPYSTETKALLSVIYFAKYKSQLKHETSEKLLRTVNFKTTDYKHLINDMENSIREEVYKEIQNYQTTKEDNVLSLMMELILTDINCNLEDIVDVNQPVNEATTPQFILGTSDLGNSIQSIHSREDENQHKNHYVQVPNRSDILSSIELNEEDKRIQSFYEEMLRMHLQLAEIKESFHKEEDRIDRLIKMAVAMQKDLKETLYLNDILHLLKGDIEKVKLKRLPFRIFYKTQEDICELNLII